MNYEALFATLLYAFLHLIVLLGFPVVALRNWRASGSRHLAFTTLGVFAIILATALALASEFFGNRLTSTHGYVHVATRVVTTFMITLGLPVVVVTAVVRRIPRHRSLLIDYAVALAAGVAAWGAAMFLSVYLTQLITRSAA